MTNYFYLSILMAGLFTCSILQAQQAQFDDISESCGLTDNNRNIGVAFGDYNNDGHDDIYVSRPIGENLLFEALGDGTFEEVGVLAGVNVAEKTRTAVWGDINNDGWLDLYLGQLDAPNRLFLNDGNGQFTDISEEAGISAAESKTRTVLMADVNNDGWLDIYDANFEQQNALYINQGNTTFVDEVYSSGATDFKKAMGAVFFDYDNDNDLDLYLTHDGNEEFILYQNDGEGNFLDVSVSANADMRGLGMGVDFGDVNNDGYLDLYVTNLLENFLLLNNGDGTFTDIGQAAGVDDIGMG
ncbi:MAG: VCBS repeat-containing protein, partial [Bacteroidota bacterium]